MEQEKNPVLDFNWKTDLEECVPANRYYSIMKHQTSLSDGTPWGIIYDTQPLFQRDEKESIKLQGDGYPEVEIPTNVWTWRRSLDKYLYQYFLLIDSKSMDQTESDWVAIKLTDEIVKKLDNYEEANKRGRARKLPVDPIFLHYLTGDERVKYDGVDYRTPRYFRACYLTFTVEAVEHRLVHKSSNVDDVEDEYELIVKCKGRTIRMVLAPKDINNAVDLIQRKLPMSTVSMAIKKPQALLINFIRRQLSALPERHYLKVTGFIKMTGAWVFAHDGAEMPGDNVVFQTGKTIPVDPALTPRGAFRNAMDLLGISDKLELMLPMILVAHLSPLFRLFEAAGYIPRFVTFISGRTGSLKTSTSLVVFRLFAEQPASPEANFKDTETALEIKLGEANGKVALLDDYRPPVTSNDGKGNLVKLESVVRAAGDRVGKSRSNPELGKAKEFLPTGCVVITGEDLGGTQSSQLRMLILSIDKGDIDGKKLKVFQDNPLLFTSHMFHFLKWAGENGDAIIEFIRSNFETERSFFAQTLREGRVIDCAATLMLTARILHAYGEAVGALPAGGGVQLLHTWRQAVLQASIASESASKIQNPVCLYVQAVFDMLDRREIMVADELKSYEANKHIGYRAGGSIWLWHRELYNRVVQYWRKVGVLFPLTCEKINGHLDSAGLIKVSYEARGAGQKKLYVCKSSLPGRSRMLVLDEAKARTYLENESD